MCLIKFFPLCVESHKYWIQVVNSNKFPTHPSRNAFCGKDDRRDTKRNKKSLFCQFIIQNLWIDSTNYKDRKKKRQWGCDREREKDFALIRKVFLFDRPKRKVSSLPTGAKPKHQTKAAKFSSFASSSAHGNYHY